MTADRLLRLYPRAWRERYGEEFLECVGPGPLRPQQVIDIVSGAIDAHLSRDVRRGTGGGRVSATEGGALMLTNLKAACVTTTPRVTTRDSLIGAAMLILGSIVFSAIGIFARRRGWEATGDVVVSLAFPASMLLTMPFLWLKGQSWRVQVLFVGVPMLILIAIGYVSTVL